MAVSKDDILETISNMSVMDVVDLISAMEEKFGVSAAAPVAVAAGPAAGGEAAEEEQTEFDLMLTSFGTSKVPAAIKEGIEQAEADELKSKLEEVGASVEIK
jgi:large subunit ribosomal protein L7/L12